MQSRIDIGDTAIAVTRYPLLWEGNLLQGLMDGGYRNKARYIGTKMCEIEATAQSYSAASPARGGGVGDACFSHLPACSASCRR